jgi:hypothetical protein
MKRKTVSILYILLPVFACLTILLSCDKTIEQKPVSFKLSSQVFEPVWTTHVVLGDLDNDGDLDAVFGNMRDFHHSKVMLNDGHGYFTPTDQDLTQQAHSAALGDLDNDGDLDIFITCANYGIDEKYYYKPSKVYLNDGDAHFQDTMQDIGDTNLGGQKIDLFDIDSDGDLDAAIVYSRDMPNKVYLNDGQGNFSETELTFPDVHEWHDLDSDGDVDLFIWNEGEGYLIRYNNGKGVFSDHSFIQDTTAIRGYAGFADIDYDGDIDAIITNGNRTESTPSKVLLNNGSGGFIISKQELNAARSGRVGIGDVNNDGYIDAVITGYEIPTHIWLNNGHGRFVDSGVRLEYNGAFYSVELGDVDLDGDLDIFIANYRGNSNQLWFNELK